MANTNLIISSPSAVSTIPTFKDPALRKATKKLAKIFADASLFAEKKNREIAVILSEVKTSKCYVKDGFASVADYAENTFGVKRQNAYKLATAGDIYRDDSVSTAVKELSPHKLAEVSNVDPETLNKAMADGDITVNTTLEGLRQYAKAAVPDKEDKPTVVPRFTARLVSYVAIPEFSSETLAAHTMDEWHDFFKKTIKAMKEPKSKRDVEVISLPKAAPGTNPLSAKKTSSRTLYLTEAYSLVVEFEKYKEPATKSGKKRSSKSDKATSYKPSSLAQFTEEELRAYLRSLEAGKNVVDAVHDAVSEADPEN